ncbi:hypothetical protein HYPSUDRAFT_185810 [Hypholoma sublateritium FD-334 SS-4]|uniref:Peregrin n=1 Tax=Hypholoma sublateritium (strain FD-334 SS-4) TaxID=945553 RepID=A0A0D2MGK5_HYPSF|nr:hypothetical protein HYPSUDRAFT_185810 [Hypholoma sublateritium FD-334 SS-4]
MARGATVTSPPAGSSLPKVEFEVIEDEDLKLPGGVYESQPISFGFNDIAADFYRPDHYIRHIEPLESELAKTVEYDMDEQDQEWLDVVNNNRTKGGNDRVTCESFEIIMDRLEKEWFDLTKNIPKPDFAMPSEDSTCAICDDSEGENSNAIVFCDGCNLAVHQDCYGVPYIPEGQWLCRKCTVSPENPVNCDLCPNEGGAFKQTVTGEWVHLLCAIWIPETRVANDVFMEPITGVDRISKQRWKLRCCICEQRYGACIQCTKPSCFVAFHATCARKEKLLMPMKSAQGAEPASLTCFCDRHLPPEQQEARATALALDDVRDRSGPNNQVGSKSARAYAKTYKPGPPLVPDIIIRRILAYINRIHIRKKPDFIHQMARYWSLKREVRRGAPLLKRLHLEPWTANAGTKTLTEEDKLMRLDQLKRLRKDLQDIQLLADLCKKREIKKLRQVEVIHGVLTRALFPHINALRLAFERIVALDRYSYFQHPVSKDEVPDYFDVIKKPMCWTIIDDKLDQNKYWNLQPFLDDIYLVVENALTYNKPETGFYKAAFKIRNEARTILAELEYLRNDNVDVTLKKDEDGHPLLGDLEPAMDVLGLLVSSDAIKDDLNMELDVEPITSLLSYEFAKVKPPPPYEPSPLPSPIKLRVRYPVTTTVKLKHKLDNGHELANNEAHVLVPSDLPAPDLTEANVDGVPHVPPQDLHESDEQEQAKLAKWQNRELQVQLDNSAGFRARTRGARAAAAAFEAEACGPSSATASVAPSEPLPPQEEPSAVSVPLKKRHVTMPAMQSSIPRVVHDVDNRDSFSMFNAGWILPPDHKRGGRVAAERQAVPPPKKRQKTDHTASRLSIVSTAASDNYTLRRTPPWSSDAQEAKHNPNESGDVPMDVDGEGERSFESRLGDHDNITHAGDDSLAINEPLNVVTQANGVVIIEKLDTPAIRREKNSRKKAEKQQRQAALVAEESVAAVSASSSTISIKKSPPPPPTIPLPSQSQPPPSNHVDDQILAENQIELKDSTFEEESELSELSESSYGRSSPVLPGEPSIPPTAPSEVELCSEAGPSEPKARKLEQPKGKKPRRRESFPDGTIVWAKSDSFPWWPAVVHSDSDPLVPRNILAAAKEKRLKRKVKLYIVQFYDKQNSWQSVAKDRLQELGEDQKLDQELLNSNQKQKWKTSASKLQCREAYRLALAAMDNEDSSAHANDNNNRAEDADGESES